MILVGAGLIFVAFAATIFLPKGDIPVQGNEELGFTPAAVNYIAPKLSLIDVGGDSVSLADYRGQVVLVNNWATWCPPCKAEMPLLNSYYQSHHQQGFVILAIDAGDTQFDVSSFTSQYGLTFPVLLDPGMKLLSGLGINSFPTSILVGRDGKVITIHYGMFTQDSINTEITPYLK